MPGLAAVPGHDCTWCGHVRGLLETFAIDDRKLTNGFGTNERRGKVSEAVSLGRLVISGFEQLQFRAACDRFEFAGSRGI